MANALKRGQIYELPRNPAEVARARLTLAAIGAALAVLVSWLPSPRAAFAAAPVAGASAQLDRAAIIAATVVTWILVVWLAAVLLVAVAARLMLGRRHGRVVTDRLAQLLLPRALRGAVITAVGVGSLAAVTGCAPGAAAAGIGTAVTATSAEDPGSSGTAAPLTIDLDWPFDPPPVSATVSTPPPFVPAPAAPDSASIETASPTTPAGPSEPAASPPASASEGDGHTSPAPTAPTAPTPAGAGTDAARPESDHPGTAEDIEEVETFDDVLDGAEPTTPSAPAASSAPTTSTAPTVDPDATNPSGTAGPVFADTAGTSTATSTAATPAPPAGSAPPPTRTMPATPPTPSAVPNAPTEPTGTVTVTAGDSLWSLAAAHLPVSASDSDIAEAWPRWHAANRGLIGDDPGHIEPGWQLTVPSVREDHTP